jgi:hypothetical protein
MTPSALWQAPLPPDIGLRLAQLLAPAGTGEKPVEVFFRADDFGRIDRHCIPLLQLFSRHNMPLCPAVVPAWLSPESWQKLRLPANRPENFCWHQHGFAHVNHERTGKKNEFGDSRSRDEIRAEISGGRKRLEEIIGEEFLPVFTPPWNRCSSITMEILHAEGFRALSRSTNVRPKPPPGLPDLAVNIDLHTRRETDPAQGLDNLLTECVQALQGGRMGFMIHHQRMNDTGFAFLELLFAAIKAAPGLRCITWRDLLRDTPQTARSGS